jgi:hypothetical protein
VSLCEEGEMRRGPQETGDVEHSFTYIFKWLDHDIPPIFPNCSSSGNIFPHLFPAEVGWLKEAPLKMKADLVT